VTPLNFRNGVFYTSENDRLRGSDRISTICSAVFTQYQRVTDGHTDGTAIPI